MDILNLLKEVQPLVPKDDKLAKTLDSMIYQMDLFFSMNETLRNMIQHTPTSVLARRKLGELLVDLLGILEEPEHLARIKELQKRV